MSTDWNLRFLQLSRDISLWSKDPSTKVGCMIIGPKREIRSTGFNGFPRGVEDTPERLNDREQKYRLVCHGEENAILHAALIGVSLDQCDLYVYPLPPCSRCSRAIIQVGIKRVFFPDLPLPERWQEDVELGRVILAEAGVEYIRYPYAPLDPSP